jgi:hypothetical protein
MAVTFKMSLIVAVFTFICLSTNAYPSNSGAEVESTTEANDTVPQDLYVIKTVVYEVGILTDASNDTDNLNDTYTIAPNSPTNKNY